MADEEKMVRLLNLQERKESIEEQLDWIDQQTAIEQHTFNRRIEALNRRRCELMNEMRDIIQEEVKGSSGVWY